MSETGYAVMAMEEPDRRPGPIEGLDGELERFESVLAELHTRLGPITNQYAEKVSTSDIPRPEPRDAAARRVERLAGLRRPAELYHERDRPLDH